MHGTSISSVYAQLPWRSPQNEANLLPSFLYCTLGRYPIKETRKVKQRWGLMRSLTYKSQWIAQTWKFNPNINLCSLYFSSPALEECMSHHLLLFHQQSMLPLNLISPTSCTRYKQSLNALTFPQQYIFMLQIPLPWESAKPLME